MAQTSRKRQTKHRGNAAGMVTSRGRTTRPLDPKAQKEKEKQEARAQSRTNVPTRYQTPPTFRSSLIRATIPTAMIFPILLLLRRTPVEALGFAATAFVIYVPMTYLLDTRMYRRYQKRAGPPAGKGPRRAVESPKGTAKQAPAADMPGLGRFLARLRPEQTADTPGPAPQVNGSKAPEGRAAKPAKPAHGKPAKPAPAKPAKPTPAGAAKPAAAKAARPPQGKAAKPASARPTPRQSAKPTPRSSARPEPRDHGEHTDRSGPDSKPSSG